MDDVKCAEITIHGLVQGVGFRHYVYKNAISIGLKGYVKNMPDGSVFIYAVGTQEQIQLIFQIASKGPPRSGIIDKHLKYLIEFEVFDNFSIR